MRNKALFSPKFFFEEGVEEGLIDEGVVACIGLPGCVCATVEITLKMGLCMCSVA